MKEQSPCVRLTIFKHLPVTSLLQFALVCKDWYEETRSVVEKFKTCTAFIRGHQPCVDLLNLNNEIPWIPWLPWRSLEINRDQLMDSNCLASALLCEAFGGRFPTVEKMVLPVLPVLPSPNFIYLRASLPLSCCPREQEISKKSSLPHLKYLEYRMDKYESSKPLFLLAILSAPNLQEVLTPFIVSSSINEVESLTPEQLKLIKWLMLEPVTTVEFSVVRLGNFSSGLRRLDVIEPLDEMTTERSRIMIVNHLLECSRSTLEYLNLAHHEQMLCLDGTLTPFPSLKYFQISIAPMTYQLPAILNGFRLGQLFPNLIALRVFFNQLYANAKQVVNLGTAVDTFQSIGNDGENSEVWPLLTRLKFHSSPADALYHKIFDHFAQKRPQITEFAYNGCGDEFPNYQIFSSFPQLKRLKLIVPAYSPTYFDEYLCGLDTEEVEELRALTVDRLKQCHVVPRRHCMHNLTDLEHFKLVIWNYEFYTSELKIILSHVTGVLIFSRWPSLKVEINGRVEDIRCMRDLPILKHLSPFAQVNYTIRNRCEIDTDAICRRICHSL